MEKQKTAVLMAVFFLLTVSFFLWQVQGGWREEQQLRYQIEVTEIELSEKQTRLDSLGTEFNSFKLKAAGDLQESQSALGDARRQLENATNHVSLVASELQEVRAEKEKQRTYYEAKMIEELQRGWQEGRQAALEGLVPLRNPTYEELMRFLAENQVNRRAWIHAKYVCVDFAADLNNDAEAAGFRSAYVWFVEGYGSDGSKWGHLLNGFQTSDKGLIFIEPQTDAVVHIQIGGRYSPYLRGTVKEIIIIW